jgi:hypothetical protein
MATTATAATSTTVDRDSQHANAATVVTALDDENVVLGDGLRSQEASSDFFSDMDVDGDGRVQSHEIRGFVEDVGSAGGSFAHLDEAHEISRGVETILQNVDRNDDMALSRQDLNNFWTQLGSLLTVRCGLVFFFPWL